jgi:cytochrome c-type biogenesis protein CcmE
MNTKTKRRMAVVTGVIVIVLIVVLAVVGSGTAAKSVSVSEAASGNLGDTKIQVSGKVVPDSYQITDNTIAFSIYEADTDEDADTSNVDPATQPQLKVTYDGGVSATFGNDVVAICTGKIGSDGVLQCSELVTKCPSKYESGTDAFTVDKLLEYGSDVYDRPVKIVGNVVSGSLGSALTDVRFSIENPDTHTAIGVSFDGGLPDGISDGSSVVLTGKLSANNVFAATNVALEG